MVEVAEELAIAAVELGGANTGPVSTIDEALRVDAAIAPAVAGAVIWLAFVALTGGFGSFAAVPFADCAPARDHSAKKHMHSSHAHILVRRPQNARPPPRGPVGDI